MFEEFMDEVRESLNWKADSKGYNEALFEFVHSNHLTHAEGEIVYKVIRYHNAHNKEDLVKICAWAYLIWKRRNESAEGMAKLEEELLEIVTNRPTVAGIPLVNCQHCGKSGLPSEWAYWNERSEKLSVTTECANILREQWHSEPKLMEIYYGVQKKPARV